MVLTTADDRDQDSPATPPVKHPGLVLLALALGAFGTTEFAAMSLLPFVARGLHVSEPTASHIISAYALGVVVGAPRITILAARFSRRGLLLSLMGLFTLANGLSTLAPSYGWMLLFRFVSGLPHGAYLGVAALVAAARVPQDRKAWAVSRVFLGLTVASWLGQGVGWRWGFAMVTALALLAMVLLLLFAPDDRAAPRTNALRELGALKRGQVWLTLGIGACGFGGMFAVYAYLASTLIIVTKLPLGLVPVASCIFGAGLTAGNLLAPVFADQALMPTAGGVLAWSIVMLLAYPFAAHNAWTIGGDIFLIGCGQALGTVLQARLMDVARDAQALAVALNHSAFNVANAIGPWLGGLAISAGYGWTSTGLVGVALAASGLAIWFVSLILERRNRTRSQVVSHLWYRRPSPAWLIQE
ncbi:MAG: MFS transporter [Janthinobacterium lividum]